MDAIKSALEPITNLLPEGAREIGVWVVLGLLVLLALGLLLILGRALFGKKRKPSQVWEKDMIDLEQCPMPSKKGKETLTVFNAPARLRLVVVAPVGRENKLTEAMVPALMNGIVPGLGAAVERDQPLIRMWPPQLSHEGFINTFHRCTQKTERDNAPSRWILVAGTAHVGKKPVLIGLGAWADEASTIGRRNLEPDDWQSRVRVTSQ